MSLEKPESRPASEILAEQTGRDKSEFEPEEDIEMPAPEDLEEVDADEFYGED